AVVLDRLVLGADHARHRVADHRPELGEQAANLRRHVALLPGPDLERLDRVGHAGTGDFLQSVDHGSLLLFVSGHSSGTAALPAARSLGGLGGARSPPTSGPALPAARSLGGLGGARSPPTSGPALPAARSLG